MMNSTPKLFALVTMAGALAGCQSGLDNGDDPGQIAFANYCAPCHGYNGEGKSDLEAPAIAGLGEWYVRAQLQKFRDGVRGAHPDDLPGLRMRPMSRTLANTAQLDAVAAYVSELPQTVAPPTLEGGDPVKGADYYAPCAACHGADGSGNVDLNAPSLTHTNDWYLLAQLGKFKTGVRGADPRDVTGAQMTPMVATLPDEQAMKDVIAHITTLSK